MNKYTAMVTLLGLFSMPEMIRATNDKKNEIRREFETLNATHPWETVFYDDCTKESANWFLDGETGTVEWSEKGMTLTAGNKENDDASHMVLWSLPEFDGQIKVSYEFTRLDTNHLENNVNILYLHAKGSGEYPYQEDISKWKELRRVPAMATYFNHMNAYHISYAVNHVPYDNDYIRARRYKAETGKGLKGTALYPEYENSGLFQPGITYHITVIATDKRIYLSVKNQTTDSLFHFDIRDSLPGGRIGLRQMWTRASRYKNFKVTQ